MAANDEYWENLLGPTEAEAAGAVGGGRLSGLKGLMSKPGVKAGLGTAAIWMAISRILGTWNQRQEQGIQREAIQSQASMATPENLYYQAALPQAQQEEEMARHALFSQLAGGVLGPQLAKGERLI